MNDWTTTELDRDRAPGQPPGTDGRPGDMNDDFERDLLKARALIERTMANYRDQLDRDAQVSEIRPGGGRVASSARKLIGEATHSVDILLSGSPDVTRAVNTAVDDLLTADAGHITVRMLCTRHTLDPRLAERFSGASGPLRMRVFVISPLTAVIVDRRKALVCAESAVGVRASVIRSASMIRTLGSLSDTIWKSATVTGDRISLGDRARSDTVRQVLRCLRLGLTDDVAARELSVSVRTYRRYVADIMALLGANSRFQAGAHASQRGLLEPAGPDVPAPASFP
ncbi:helix-turn-helix transcriptional regulator [Actinacidiphila acidipaludis]|uniref:Helix-turn-helix transcriptional regulator n=1 Tax=Actinacidiphila acidipaludis TaxID=2873382 RepID=A0ABS7Q2Q5_9ACTN|nr:helix-turn-helix transcriptional regulator [Streptomyces acidipaludis]MBY8877420.1 helix-turn-helix transcriptional regulator [Streptomyces acidipaludis]